MLKAPVAARSASFFSLYSHLTFFTPISKRVSVVRRTVRIFRLILVYSVRCALNVSRVWFILTNDTTDTRKVSKYPYTYNRRGRTVLHVCVKISYCTPRDIEDFRSFLTLRQFRNASFGFDRLVATGRLPRIAHARNYVWG